MESQDGEEQTQGLLISFYFLGGKDFDDLVCHDHFDGFRLKFELGSLLGSHDYLDLKVAFMRHEFLEEDLESDAIVDEAADEVLLRECHQR